jgi:hypothetical protein
MNSLDALALAGSRYGKIDLACPICGPGCKSPVNRKRKVLRIWRHETGFATYHCCRCGEDGFSLEGKPVVHRARRPTDFRHERDDEANRTRRALAIWAEALPISNTLAARYLINRKVDLHALPDEMEHVLRFHPRCPWGQGTAPCMVALWTSIHGNAPKAIHRTALTPDAQDNIVKMSLGPTRDCVIRL